MEVDAAGASALPEALRADMRPFVEAHPGQTDENLSARLFVGEDAAVS